MGQPPATTIVAPATAAGRSALAVLRISGPIACRIASKLSAREGFEPRRPTLGPILDQHGNIIDEAVVTCFPGPRSATGEDLIEISCHGSPIIVRSIVDTCLHWGAEPAKPGEFTKRAFLNGRIDLTQAEAVEDLVRSETIFQARRARDQLRGALSKHLEPQKRALIEVAAQLETAVEFVEDDVEPAGRQVIERRLGEVDQCLEELLTTFRGGRLVRDGLRVVIAGPPNSGKSSVFNRLLLFERAITSPVPGTTRDVLEESVEIEGVAVTLVDTAGWRGTEDPVERAGVDRTKQQLGRAQLVLLVLDGSEPEPPDLTLLQECDPATPIIAVGNKDDLGVELDGPLEVGGIEQQLIRLSAKTGSGFVGLKKAIQAVAWPPGGLEVEGAVLTRSRHRRAVLRSREELSRAREALETGLSEEFPLYNLRKALEALGEITGEVTPEDVLDEIFATFCIGK